jgi:MOSC domain-containing protein YiiM
MLKKESPSEVKPPCYPMSGIQSNCKQLPKFLNGETSQYLAGKKKRPTWMNRVIVTGRIKDRTLSI